MAILQLPHRQEKTFDFFSLLFLGPSPVLRFLLVEQLSLIAFQISSDQDTERERERSGCIVDFERRRRAVQHVRPMIFTFFFTCWRMLIFISQHVNISTSLPGSCRLIFPVHPHTHHPATVGGGVKPSGHKTNGQEKVSGDCHTQNLRGLKKNEEIPMASSRQKVLSRKDLREMRTKWGAHTRQQQKKKCSGTPKVGAWGLLTRGQEKKKKPKEEVERRERRDKEIRWKRYAVVCLERSSEEKEMQHFCPASVAPYRPPFFFPTLFFGPAAKTVWSKNKKKMSTF